MTKITINKIKTYYDDLPPIKSISFDFLGEKVYSADKLYTIYGSYISNVIEASENLIKWYEATWTENKDDYSDVYLFVRSATSQTDLESSTWSGPYNDEIADISDENGRYMQFCFVIKEISGFINLANISDIKLKYYTSEGAVKFFTRTFDIGFTPKNVVLTYNADLNDNSIIRFAISGIDTADVSYYQYIEPNKIVNLDNMTYLSDKIKVLMELVGTNETEVSVHEFALMFSGENAFRLNKVYKDTSSSTSSTSSSTSSSSSMSSESIGNTSSSSSSSSWRYSTSSTSKSSSSSSS